MPSRDDLISALSLAAELEHSITCQYLFAAFSLKTHPSEGNVDWPQLERLRHFKAELLSIAREEMVHHGLVLNLMIIIGGAPHVGRPPFPHVCSHTPPYDRHDLLPFGEAALQRFAAYEALHTPDDLESVPDGAAGRSTIGNLYKQIHDDFALVDRSNPRLFIGPKDHQIDNTDLRIGPGQFDIELSKAFDLQSAQGLIDPVLDHDHHARVVAIQQELAEMRRRDPEFVPTRPVVANPSVLRCDEDVAEIRHPITRGAAELFNHAYEIMILLLGRIYGRPKDLSNELDGLVRTTFFPLMTSVIRPLGEILTQMPLDDESTVTAGAPFEFSCGYPLQSGRTSAWVVVHERLMAAAESSAKLSQELNASQQTWARQPLRSRFELLHQNLDRIAANFERYMGLRSTYVQHMLKRIF